MASRTAWVLVLLALACGARAQDALQVSGFALLRGAAGDAGVPFDDDHVAAQVQVGIDWRPNLPIGGHVHLLARSDADGSRRGHVGIVQAYLDQTFTRGAHRVRLMEGAFFLPTSRENVDALWETPYTITSSALNSWLGEEFRPIGVDAAYTFRRRWTAAATLYTGNDTLGALPPVRGWTMNDRWALLGEHIVVDEEYFTSVSAETDHRIGWSARGRWSTEDATVQLTHFDNRSDALEHGELLNWDTRFTIASADVTRGDWTVAAASGWGATDVIVDGIRFPSDIAASYVLLSRRLPFGRASLRAEEFRADDHRTRALTGTLFWTPRGTRLRVGLEGAVAGDRRRATLEFRWSM